MFDPNERDGYNDPAIYLRERFSELGYDFKAADNNSLEGCEWIFFNDVSSVLTYSGWRGMAKKTKSKIKNKLLVRNVYDECIQAGMKDRLALFLWEAPAACPKNWDSKLHKMFPVIFTWHDTFVDGRKVFKICWPQTRKFTEIPKIPFAKKKLLINISMNKFSHYPKELYSARRAAIRYFERNYSDDFDLYGVGWNRPMNLLEKVLPFTQQIYPSYRGTVKNKWDVMPYYRFSLCYENVRDEPGYITEKIFDSMRCGCVPIYWGALNINDYVDAGAFIDRRRFKDDSELDKYLCGITEHEYERFQKAIRSYLASPRFARFLPSAYADTIIQALGLTAQDVKGIIKI